jgi:hypothetical protein
MKEPVEAVGAVDAKNARPPLLGKLQNSFPRASTGIVSDHKGTFLSSLDTAIEQGLRDGRLRVTLLQERESQRDTFFSIPVSTL